MKVNVSFMFALCTFHVKISAFVDFSAWSWTLACVAVFCVWWRMTWAEVSVRMHGIFVHKSAPNEGKCILTEFVPREKEDIVVSMPKSRWFYSVKFVCLHAASAGAMAFYK